MTGPSTPAGRRASRPVRWWQGRTLHGRLALLVTGAVTVAVIAVAGFALAVVAELQHRQLQSTLSTDAHLIAAQPDQWRSSGAALPTVDRPDAGDRHRGDLGPHWQILDPQGTVIGGSLGDRLPVTAVARQVAAGAHREAQENVVLDGQPSVMLTVPVVGGGAVQVALSSAPGHVALLTLALLLAIACAAGIGGAAILGRFVARAGLRPVQRVTAAVETVAATTDLGHPVPVSGTDEIARLGRAVNTMLAAIDGARQAQRTLVEDASHELRTPLTSIRTNVELLLAIERQPELATRLPAEDRVKLLADLEAQIGELATLTTELVELARDETSREDVELVDLSDVVSAAIDRVRMRAPTIAFQADLREVPVHGRPGELERMVVNVLDNAAKWSPPGATVRTRLGPGPDGWCELVVADAGPGIDEPDRPYVFDRFYRSPAARAQPGSGLGLAIVAQTATQHGGTVTTAANHPQGTVVTVRLPIPREASTLD